MSGRDGGGAARVIAWLVGTYPVEVRHRFGEELYGVTKERWLAARARGRAAGVWWWATEGRALAFGAVRDHVERRVGVGSIGRGGRNPWKNKGEGMMAEAWWLIREMRRNLRFSASLILVLTLALGIGVNVAVVSWVQALLLRPLPYPDADQLVIDRWHGILPDQLL